MALALINKMQLKKGIPIDSTASMKETAKIGTCACKKKPCSCERGNGVNNNHHPLGFSIPAMNSHITALTPSPDLAYLLTLQSLTRAHYNGPELPKRVTAFNGFADSSQVTSSNQVLADGRRRRKKEEQPLFRLPFARRNKASNQETSNSEEKKYHCDFCGDSFGYKHVLQNHVRTHTGEKPFQCLEPDCGKRFTRDHHLKTHMRLHTGEKPFKCDYCDKKFVQVANLRRHMRVHTGERPYACDFESCQSRFSDSNQLNAHRLSHKESKPAVIVNDEVELKPLTTRRPIYLPYYQYLSHHEMQEEPEDLSLKSRHLILP